MSSVFLKKVFVEFSRPFQKCARARIQAACTRKKRAAEAAKKAQRARKRKVVIAAVLTPIALFVIFIIAINAAARYKAAKRRKMRGRK